MLTRGSQRLAGTHCVIPFIGNAGIGQTHRQRGKHQDGGCLRQEGQGSRELSGEVVMSYILTAVWVTGICSCQNSAKTHLRFMHYNVKFYIKRKKKLQISLVMFVHARHAKIFTRKCADISNLF